MSFCEQQLLTVDCSGKYRYAHILARSLISSFKAGFVALVQGLVNNGANECGANLISANDADCKFIKFLSSCKQMPICIGLAILYRQKSMSVVAIPAMAT